MSRQFSIDQYEQHEAERRRIFIERMEHKLERKVQAYRNQRQQQPSTIFE